ncbi:MAG: NEW3 domain-containing protein [Archaeoglobaceae archaeon]
MKTHIALSVFLALTLTASISCDVYEVNAVPGETLKFAVTVKNDEDDEKFIYLSYHAPEGFTGRFLYEGKIVESLKLNSGEEKSLEFQLYVPVDADGVYFVTLYADGSYTIRVNVGYPENPIRVHSPVTGVAAEAGDTVKFRITVENLLTGDYPLRLGCVMPKGWKCRYIENNAEVYSIVLKAGESRNIELEVETDSSSDVGVYKVLPLFNGYHPLKLEVRITKTHRGEKGEVKLTVVDRDGKGVASARVSVDGYEFFTSAEGRATFEVPPGVYTVKISRGGYYDKEIKDVEVRAGKTTDLGTIYLEKRAYYVELVVSNPKMTATLGVNPVFEFRVENMGYADDTYRLKAEGLPADVFPAFKVDGVTVSEIFLEGGESKDVRLELIFPPATKPGKYEFKLCVVGQYAACRNLTLNLQGEYRVLFEPEGGRYLFIMEVGEIRDINAIVRNVGRGATLTNVNISVEAPRGWEVDVRPSVVPAIEPYEGVPVKITVSVPPDAIPSEYKLKVEITSDQTGSTEELRIVVREKSYATVIGVAIVIAAVAGVLLVFRKFGRR